MRLDASLAYAGLSGIVRRLRFGRYRANIFFVCGGVLRTPTMATSSTGSVGRRRSSWP